MKMKTFVLTVSKTFPATHQIHTIRSNYTLWAKRAKEINEGKAVLSIRYWIEKPYRSNQIEICRLEKIGIEKLIDPN